MTTTTTATPRRRSDLQLLQALARELTPSRRSFALAVSLYAPLTLLSVLQPVVIGAAIDDGFREGDVAAVLRWSGVFVALVGSRAVVEAWQGLLMQALGQAAVTRIRARLFAKLQRLPLAYFDQRPLGRVMTRVTNDTESVAELFSSGAVSLVGDVLFLIGTMVMLFIVDVQLSWAALCTTPLLVIGVQWFRRRARQAFGRVRAAQATLNATLQELLSGMAIVQLFARVDTASERLDRESVAYTDANKEAIFLDAGVYSFVDAISVIALAVTLAAAGALGVKGVVPDGVLSLGVLVAFIDALGRFFLPVRDLSNKTTVIQSALVAAERITELQDEPETITAPTDHVAVARFESSLRLVDVHFAYAGGPPVLQGLSFTVRKGERIGIVGHTGAGKSTLLKLIPRLYDVTSGAILMDEVDTRRFAPRDLRRLTTAVPQETFLFRGTIGENLRFGAPDQTDEQLLTAARACCCEDVVERHGGLSGAVAERGQNLSLGERQLLALTRALVCNPPLVILDEATASVDRETERLLQSAQEQLIAGRTALIVAHRLSTIERCDRILVLHEGRLVEEGSHADLLAKGGRYAALVELQQALG
jgi:ATP-binding cassette subfamily B multidrug efflux pump